MTPEDKVPLIPADADLERPPLALLETEIAPLEKLIGLDRDTTNRFSAVSKRIVEETAALEKLTEKLTDHEAAQGRCAELVREREVGYGRIFSALLAEEAVLNDLYGPLMARLAAGPENLRKLSFSVKREADVQRWAEAGEELLDLRRLGPFKGRGMLQRRAKATLKAAWETGDAAAVLAAMAKFRSENQSELLEHALVPKSEPVGHRNWLKRFAQWLYSTQHTSVNYSVDYGGTDIRKLSPGSRGIVLLLLYLALDDADYRPLIIDQPEENLDPKSVFEELVDLFSETKRKRQVNIITHNANLVVNTDADQIIIAKCGPHLAGTLPPIF